MGRTATLEQAELFDNAFGALTPYYKLMLIDGLNIDAIEVNETAVVPYYMPAMIQETLRNTRERVGEWIDHVKIGYSHQPKELRVIPKTWIRKLGQVVFERDSESGGHFFAYEMPEQLVKDLRDMFRKGGGAYGVVQGKKGYKEAAKL